MIVYHGSNVIVSEPKLVHQNRFWTSGLAFIQPQIKFRQLALQIR